MLHYSKPCSSKERLVTFSPFHTNDRLEASSEIAKKYCLIKDDKFVLPSRDDLVGHRVVVTTLSTSKVLLDLQVLHGFFTHILFDEATQALEPETLTPLIFAGPNTKVVFTGDHMQVKFKGALSRYFSIIYNAEVCSRINGNPNIMMQFCYLGLYHYTETNN